MMEKRPHIEKTMRTQRECTMAPMKSRRQKTANNAEKSNKLMSMKFCRKAIIHLW